MLYLLTEDSNRIQVEKNNICMKTFDTLDINKAVFVLV